jgi:Fe-S-cluster-containing dehydrogenase component
MGKAKEKRLAMVINTRRCLDCKACMMACKVENDLPCGFWRNWVRNDSVGVSRRTQYQPGQCMQCEEPSCVAACPVGATWRQADGVVIIDPIKCIGCGNCVTACPYGARYRNPVTRIADKCDFCSQRLARGQLPACVETCPTRARVFGDLNDPESEVSKLVKSGDVVTVVSPQVNTKPQIFYLAGTTILDWAHAPSLPGGVHMPPEFWRVS